MGERGSRWRGVCAAFLGTVTLVAVIPVVVISVAGATVPVAAQGSAQDEKPVFDPAADAVAQVEAAIATAREKEKRALVVWGGERVAGSVELVRALEASRKETGWPLYYEYQLVTVDVSAGEHIAELADRLGAELVGGLPLVSVLDAKGAALAHERGARWRGEGGYDAQAIAAFLKAHKVAAKDAEKVLAAGLARAEKEGKRLLVHLGAPW